MASLVKLAMIQMHPEPLAPEVNHAKAVSFIRRAASQGCHIAILPEYHLTSWVPSNPRFLTHQCHSDYQVYLSSYCGLAKELNINIVPGTIIERHRSTCMGPISLTTPAISKHEAEDDIEAEEEFQLHNKTHFISSAGSLVASYQKRNLWHPERAHLSPSLPHHPHHSHRIFPTGLGFNAGLLICWDLAFPEAFRELVAQGAKMIFVPAFWGNDDAGQAGRKWNEHSEEVYLRSVCTARACEGTVGVVLCNVGGPSTPAEEDGVNAATHTNNVIKTESESKTSSREKQDEPAEEEWKPENWLGVSHLAMPFLGPMGVLGAEEGMSIVEVDMQVLEDAEASYGMRRDLESEGWHYDYALKGNSRSQTP